MYCIKESSLLVTMLGLFSALLSDSAPPAMIQGNCAPLIMPLFATPEKLFVLPGKMCWK